MEEKCLSTLVRSYLKTLRRGLRFFAGSVCVFALAVAAEAQDGASPPPAPQPSAAVIAPDDTEAVAIVVPQSSDSIAVPQPVATNTRAQPSSIARPAPSSDTAKLERRIRDLEATLQQMQAHQGQSLEGPAPGYPVPPAPAPGETPERIVPPESSAFNPIGSEGGPSALDFQEPFKGFYIESPDKVFSLRITGQVQLDYREFLNTKDRTDIDTFLLRRARFGLEATLAKYYEFRFLPDFGSGTTIVQDAYMNAHWWDALQFEVGRFKQPISYEQLIQDRYVPTLERSLMDQLVPQRDLGAMIHGEQIFDNRLDYGVSISNGEINGNSTDLNNHKDVDGRMAIRPLNSPELPPWLNYLGIGVSGGFGIEQEAISPATLRMEDTVPFLNFNSTVRADGLRTRLCPEFTYFYGPFGFMAQYYEEHQQMQPSATGAGSKIVIDVPFMGYTLLATLLLTGETRTTWSEQLMPLRPFDPRSPIRSPGAWELVARVARLDLDDVFEKGAAQLVNPKNNSNEAMDVTVGFNWYLNGWLRTQFNYEHDMFGQPVLLGSTADNELKSQDSLFTRLMVVF
jgi:phosphate-selective porin OprO and OprP